MDIRVISAIFSILFIIITITDYKTDILKVKNYKKININKVLLFFIIVIISLIITYINDYLTYNYFDDELKKDIPKSDICYSRSLVDAINAGVSEELVFRLLIFNIILIKYLKIDINKSIIISSLLFGLSHINQYISYGTNLNSSIVTIIQAIPVGMLLCYLYVNTNLTTAIIAHFLIDYIDFIFLRCNKNIYKKMLFIN